MAKWFTEKGATGEVLLERRGKDWFVASPPGDGDIKCMLEDEELVDSSSTEQRVEATVSNFMRGTGGDESFLFLSSPNAEHESEANESESNDRSPTPTPSDSKTSWTSNETWQLKDFRGSGEYVDVEATIDSVFYAKKDTNGVPDIKGELTDDSVLNPVYFIVEDGTTHPYLKEGKRFLFRNVKDHYYKKQAEVQVVISNSTDFIER
ncbi:hypothetical protein SAMN04487967_0389 [Natronorubrum sediminis]|uniref:Uncharacterized protein n=1 Tax=Natronorubrum sediminis TaxID=640943 RepID=A0A1H6FMC4_9EURY|nr:hypothetical protein [Natronorubrum sediminis]SEH11522.1 hypothetical protein SAMN04487967_0389 [Natronorubrum sediminis]